MEESSPTCKTCSSWWRLPLLLALVLAAIWLVRGRGMREGAHDLKAGGGDEAAFADTIGPRKMAVSLAINFGNGKRTVFPPVAWRKGITVQEAMSQTFRNDARFVVQGSGESAFLTSVDGVANEGAGGRNWTYTVNGKHADRSFAVYTLEPGDQVLWTFGEQQ
jgi:hypothetical protein